MAYRERSVQTEGVIVKHHDWGEADRLLILFTKELGRVQAIAKGVRKARSRKAGHLEPFTKARLLLARGRDLYILTQAEAIDPYQNIKKDLLNMSYGFYVVELLYNFTYEEGENRDLYQLLVNTLDRLNHEDDPNIVTHYYEIRLLDIAGFRPQLFFCAQCEKEIIAEDQFFSAIQGGVLCPNCGRRSTDSQPISKDALRYLRHFQRSSYQEATKAQIKHEINIEIENLLQFYITYILERVLNTPSFIKRIIKERISLPEEDS